MSWFGYIKSRLAFELNRLLRAHELRPPWETSIVRGDEDIVTFSEQVTLGCRDPQCSGRCGYRAAIQLSRLSQVGNHTIHTHTTTKKKEDINVN